MKFLHWILFLGVFSASFAAVPAAKKKAAPKAVGKKSTSSKSGASKTGATKSGSASASSRPGVQGKTPVARRAGARTRGPARPVSSGFRSRQTVPTPERYKEIQEALATKGYLKSDPNGVWDAQSAEALKQFQTDHNLSPTGKLSAASLIGLGLGPKAAGAVTVPGAADPSITLPEPPRVEPVPNPQP